MLQLGGALRGLRRAARRGGVLGGLYRGQRGVMSGEQLLEREEKRFVVLDDDPTGCQTVHDVNVLLDFDVDSLCTQLQLDEKCFYVLTNSRGMTEPDAIAVTSLVLSNLKQACERIDYKKPLSFISRGDSCLRGHYPAEVDTIKKYMKGDNIVTIMMPAFVEGGRITKDSIHYVKEEGQLIPVADTPFAKDPHFSFKSSNLREYVVEKSEGNITDAQVKSVTLSDLRDRGVEHVESILASCVHDDVVVVDLEESSDMATFITALLRTEQLQNQSFVYRTAASFVAGRCGIPKKPLLEAADVKTTSLTSKSSTGGLIVVGSYVPKTTAQLSNLCNVMDIHEVEFDVGLFNKLLLTSPDLVKAMTTSMSQQISKLLTSGKHVVLYTSRREVSAASDSNENSASIKDFTAVSDALTAIVSELDVTPSFLIAKGGITSHDVAHKGLNVSQARVIGQIETGIPVWQTMEGSKFPGLNYVVFPGNVGSVATLAHVAEKLGVPRRSDAELVRVGSWNKETKARNQTYQILSLARENEEAIAAFNIYNLEGAKAAVEAAEEQQTSILLQVHPSSLEFGGRELMTMLCAFRDNACVAVSVHLDHSTRETDIRLALSCGVDSIMVDGSHLSLEENISFTKNMAQLAHEKGVLVEAELGRLAGEEDGLSVSEKEAKMTDPAIVEHFVRETNVDMLAVTIGNVHGKYKYPPDLDFERMESIRRETVKAADGEPPCLLVLHGASGLSEEIITRAVKGGVCKFNVNTDLRSAAIASIRHAVDSSDETKQIDVLGLMSGSYKAMKKIAKNKIDCFRLQNKY